jgi:hypothetical protein
LLWRHRGDDGVSDGPVWLQGDEEDLDVADVGVELKRVLSVVEREVFDVLPGVQATVLVVVPFPVRSSTWQE